MDISIKFLRRLSDGYDAAQFISATLLFTDKIKYCTNFFSVSMYISFNKVVNYEFVQKAYLLKCPCPLDFFQTLLCILFI